MTRFCPIAIDNYVVNVLRRLWIKSATDNTAKGNYDPPLLGIIPYYHPLYSYCSSHSEVGRHRHLYLFRSETPRKNAPHLPRPYCWKAHKANVQEAFLKMSCSWSTCKQHHNIGKSKSQQCLVKKDVMRLGARSTFTDSLCWQLAGRLEGTGKEKKKKKWNFGNPWWMPSCCQNWSVTFLAQSKHRIWRC